MPIPPPVDDDLDPLEVADQEEAEDDQGITAEPETDAHAQTGATAGDENDTLEEVEKVTKQGGEEQPAKPKAHMIPRHLIDQELKPEDLWDEGSI